jgi:hypothetical protein
MPLTSEPILWIATGAAEPDREAVVILDYDTRQEAGFVGPYYDPQGNAKQDARQWIQREFMPFGFEVSTVVEVAVLEGPHWQLPIGTVLISQG